MDKSRDDKTGSVAKTSSARVSSKGSTISLGRVSEMTAYPELIELSPRIEGCRSLPRDEACSQRIMNTLVI